MLLRNIFIIFVLVFTYKLISSIVNFINIIRYKKMYENYLCKKSNTILQYKTACLDLFKKANISDAKVPISQKTGYGQIANFKASLFQEFPDNTTLFAPETRRIFEDAIGIYRRKVVECFSPIYWINFILFLPKNVLIYLQVSADSIFIRIIQFIYWLFGIALTLFSSDITDYIKSLL